MQQSTTNDVDIQPSASSDDEALKRVLGQPLVQAIDAYARDPNAETLGNYSAALVGRVTEILTTVELRIIRVAERVDQLEAARDGS
jgi:hypothetical protein